MVSEFRDDRIVLRNDTRGSNAGKTHLFNLRDRILSNYSIIFQYVPAIGLEGSHDIVMISHHDTFLWAVSIVSGFRDYHIVLRNNIRGSNTGKTPI